MLPLSSVLKDANSNWEWIILRFEDGWEYSPEKYYERLMAVYVKAVELGPGGLN